MPIIGERVRCSEAVMRLLHNEREREVNINTEGMTGYKQHTTNMRYWHS